MANDGKIYITISDKRFGNNVAEADAQNQIDKEKEKKDKPTVSDFAQHKFFNMIEAQAKQAVTYTLGNIGNFTGNYITQQQVNNALEAVNFLESVGMAALAGSKFGWQGALISAGVSILTQGATRTLNTFTGMLDNTRQNIAIDQLRTRAGLNGTNNGSRGTEY